MDIWLIDEIGLTFFVAPMLFVRFTLFFSSHPWYLASMAIEFGPALMESFTQWLSTAFGRSVVAPLRLTASTVAPRAIDTAEQLYIDAHTVCRFRDFSPQRLEQFLSVIDDIQNDPMMDIANWDSYRRVEQGWSEFFTNSGGHQLLPGFLDRLAQTNMQARHKVQEVFTQAYSLDAKYAASVREQLVQLDNINVKLVAMAESMSPVVVG